MGACVHRARDCGVSGARAVTAIISRAPSAEPSPFRHRDTIVPAAFPAVS